MGLSSGCREKGQDDVDQARYALVILPSGSFSFDIVTADGQEQVLHSRSPSPAIRTGGAVIRLTVRCDGATITLAINDQVVATHDGAALRAGEIGLIVTGPGAEVAFHDLRVTPLP